MIYCIGPTTTVNIIPALMTHRQFSSHAIEQFINIIFICCVKQCLNCLFYFRDNCIYFNTGKYRILIDRLHFSAVRMIKVENTSPLHSRIMNSINKINKYASMKLN